MDLNMAKKTSVTYRNPVAKAMLQERKSPQVILPKKGNKAKRNRQQEKIHAIRNAKLYQDD
jgi:hypothetical protein